MQNNIPESDEESGYARCVSKAMARTHELLREEGCSNDYEKIHSVKAILSAAIERADTESERLISAQELLRELITLVVLQADPHPRERHETLKILEKLRKCHELVG